MKYNIKQISILIIILVVIGSLISYILQSKNNTPVPEKGNIVATNELAEVIAIKPIEMCYDLSDKTSRGFYDKALIKMQITGDKVIGEFKDIPSEKDSKVGKFEGTVGLLNKETMSRRANLLWDSEGEGMSAKEELIIDFGDGSAVVGYGEMVDNGNNVYVYKDKTKLIFSKNMSQIDCGTLDEKVSVEKYIKDNITTIAKEKAVLGGSWYVISVFVNPSKNTADVIFEDGHIQNKAQIIYTYTKEDGVIKIDKVTKII